TYLALTFGTLLSSQGTDASFVLTLSGFPPGFRSAFRVPDSIRLFRVRFPAGGILLLSFRLLGRSDIQNSSGFPGRLIIEPVE
ncbi:hypothetical protein, partial [Streptomyces albidochromogenes]|uniref:hypothetical protein n=1 Tax=Streptomyces albidochromogenes TaxID=329524 RepID=UPI001ABF7874